MEEQRSSGNRRGDSACEHRQLTLGAWLLLAPWSPPSPANKHGCFGTQKINCQTILAGSVSWGSFSTLSTHCQQLGVLDQNGTGPGAPVRDHGWCLLETSLQKRKRTGRGKGVGVGERDSSFTGSSVSSLSPSLGRYDRQ